MLLLDVVIVMAMCGSLAAVEVAGGSTESVTADGTDRFEQLVRDIQPGAARRAWNSIIVHHSATRGGDVAAIDAVHRRNRDRAGNPWLGIGYHFVIGNGHNMADGEVQATFRWQQQLSGAHAGTRELNERGIGICLIGNFDEQPPTPRQLAAACELTKVLARQHSIARESVRRHRDVQATACPGRLFPWEQLLSHIPATGA